MTERLRASRATLKNHGLTSHQQDEIIRLQQSGWRYVQVKRLHDDDNPIAAVEMRDPDGHQKIVGCPTTKRLTDQLLRTELT